jgi:hypothetical protein
MVVVRVTGPASRREEILRDLDALLAGVRLPKGSEPLPSNVITVEGCPLNSSDPNAEIRLPKGGEALGIALSLQPNVGDETGQAVENPLRAVPQRMCLESSDTKNKIPLLTLKAVAAAPAVYAPRRYVLYGDAGQIVEILESRKEPGQFFALRHGIGTMYVVGKFQGLPSATQIWGLIAAPEDAPAVVVYRSRFLKGDGSDNFEINCNLTQEGCAKAKDSKK